MMKKSGKKSQQEVWADELTQYLTILKEDAGKPRAQQRSPQRLARLRGHVHKREDMLGLERTDFGNKPVIEPKPRKTPVWTGAKADGHGHGLG